MVDRVSFFFPIPDTLASSYVLKTKIFLVPPPSISEAVPTLPSDDVIIMLKHIASISEAASTAHRLRIQPAAQQPKRQFSAT